MPVDISTNVWSSPDGKQHLIRIEVNGRTDNIRYELRQYNVISKSWVLEEVGKTPRECGVDIDPVPVVSFNLPRES